MVANVVVILKVRTAERVDVVVHFTVAAWLWGGAASIVEANIEAAVTRLVKIILTICC